MARQQLNSTFPLKARLRMQALELLRDPPVICETHGGLGRLYESCYTNAVSGCVFETKPLRAEFLARQRPTWAVYEEDSAKALSLGVGAHLTVNLLDVDPFGSPWPAIEAWFASDRPRAARLSVVVNDGLRQKLKTGSAWTVHCLQTQVQKYGNNLYPVYLGVCEEKMSELASTCGYVVGDFHGYYCGNKHDMAHYLAVLNKVSA